MMLPAWNLATHFHVSTPSRDAIRNFGGATSVNGNGNLQWPFSIVSPASHESFASTAPTTPSAR